jgi:hypothetical protein
MELRKNKIHMKKLMTKYEEDLGDAIEATFE